MYLHKQASIIDSVHVNHGQWRDGVTASGGEPIVCGDNMFGIWAPFTRDRIRMAPKIIRV